MNLQLDGQIRSVLGIPAPRRGRISDGSWCIYAPGGNEWAEREAARAALSAARQERDISGLKEERSALDKHWLGPPSENH